MFPVTNRLDSEIINHLQSGERHTSEILAHLRLADPSLTRQAMYQALRRLEARGVLVRRRGHAALRVHWLRQMSDFFNGIHIRYTRSTEGVGSFARLGPGEKISYTFQSAAVADAFWNQALYVLLELTSGADSFYAYNPHCWFLLARTNEEQALIKALEERGRKYLLTAGANTALDRYILKELRFPLVQYHRLSQPLFSSQRYYVNVVGEFLVEVLLERHVAEEIERLYTESLEVDDAALLSLKEIVGRRGKTKITISRNGRAAEKVKRMLRKAFF